MRMMIRRKKNDFFFVHFRNFFGCDLCFCLGVEAFDCSLFGSNIDLRKKKTC